MPHDNGHWVGVEADPNRFLGFIYRITDVTEGKYYVGKKQYFLAKQGVTGCKSKTSDRRSENWKSRCWKDSDWRTYKGSSPSLKKWMKKYPDHEYRYEILHQCYNKSELHYKEIEEIVARGALWEKHEDGTFLYFNQSLPAMRFRVENRIGETLLFNVYTKEED